MPCDAYIPLHNRLDERLGHGVNPAGEGFNGVATVPGRPSGRGLPVQLLPPLRLNGLLVGQQPVHASEDRPFIRTRIRSPQHPRCHRDTLYHASGYPCQGNLVPLVGRRDTNPPSLGSPRGGVSMTRFAYRECRLADSACQANLSVGRSYRLWSTFTADVTARQAGE